MVLPLFMRTAAVFLKNGKIVCIFRNADVHGLNRAVSISLRKFKTIERCCCTDSLLVGDCAETKNTQWVEFDLFHVVFFAVFEHFYSISSKEKEDFKTRRGQSEHQEKKYTPLDLIVFVFSVVLPID